MPIINLEILKDEKYRKWALNSYIFFDFEGADLDLPLVDKFLTHPPFKKKSQQLRKKRIYSIFDKKWCARGAANQMLVTINPPPLHKMIQVL